jgi:cytochrome c oxidase subunit II
MKKVILFVFGVLSVLLLGACSQQPNNDFVGQGSDVSSTAVENPQAHPIDGSPETDTEVIAGQPAETEQAQTQGSDVKEFMISAKQFSFDPENIEVNKGDKVRLIVTSIDVPHGIAIREYGINERLEVGKPVTIEFTADKEGSFTAFCSVFCGSGHGNMKGKLIVK